MIIESILGINSNIVSIENIINDNIKLVKENKLKLKNFECIEDLQKAILSKWLNEENSSFAHVFYSAPLNMMYTGFSVTLQSIIIKGNIIEVTQYSRDFEVFYFSDYKMPYISSINNIQKVSGKNNIVITFKDGFRFSAIPNNNEEVFIK